MVRIMMLLLHPAVDKCVTERASHYVHQTLTVSRGKNSTPTSQECCTILGSSHKPLPIGTATTDPEHIKKALALLELVRNVPNQKGRKRPDETFHEVNQDLLIPLRCRLLNKMIKFSHKIANLYMVSAYLQKRLRERSSNRVSCHSAKVSRNSRLVRNW